VKNRASASSADNGKIIQIDNNQLINYPYLCQELGMKFDGDCHQYSDRLVC